MAAPAAAGSMTAKTLGVPEPMATASGAGTGWTGNGLPTLTLTTFADVLWNAPYYARLGFDVIPNRELSAGLRGLREHEAAIGLDAWPRVAMRRPVSTIADVR